MKKKMMALLLGLVMVCNCSVSSFATETIEDEKVPLASPENIYIGDLSTATQTDAKENATDVDEDIKEEVEEQVPERYVEIVVESADDLIKLARDCRYDVWSVNKRVVLANDISFRGKEFYGIPTFGGIFDGQGHSITDISISGGISYTGLFCNLQRTAVVMDLSVSGTITPSGEQIMVGGVVGDNEGMLIRCHFKGVVSGKDYVGGLVGMNELTGVVSGCTSDGYIHGTHFTGGLVGENMGDIVGCTNEAFVNTTNEDTKLSVDAMASISKVVALIKNIGNNSEEAAGDITVSDAGGIAGLSIGIISKCINNGDIGYEHVGYNIGGIVGRQSGFVIDCSNNGTIRGRKDVGGIVGQAEPYITVDLSQDIAYQLTEAISKLHDIVTKTLGDAKNQSGVVSGRLSTIQKFTAGAIDDVRFLADGTVDYANGVSGAATEAFSRVEYVLDEASKKDGMLDQVTYAAGSTKEAGKNFSNAVGDLDIDAYIDSDDEREQYNYAKTLLASINEQYSNNYKKAYDAYYNYYIARETDDHDYEDLRFKPKGSDSFVPKTDYKQKDEWKNTETIEANIINENKVGANQEGKWYRLTDGDESKAVLFPTNAEKDTELDTSAKGAATSDAASFAMSNYKDLDGNKGNMVSDMAYVSSVISTVILNHIDQMTDDARTDAQKALYNLEDAAGNLETAGKQAKDTIGNIAGRNPIAFPQFSGEYKAHTASLANNLQGMNDNFGLLNQEVNNANEVIIDDLQAMADQFNVIMNLYTDAVDGVLDADYTTAFEDVSFAEAENCMDATIDRCSNFGRVEGDIDCAGIAGTMAIEYDFDMESDITGIKDSRLNTSYITKCVLRNVRNYGIIIAEKNYVGGICGLQEMGTILGGGNYSNIQSSSGEFVGGIAGSSLSYINSSFSRGIMEGEDYVGGIVGDGLNIRNSFSLVDIVDADSWFGAIAGHVDEKGEVRNNFFISDTLAGIDRISYTKKAEPVSYSDISGFDLFEEGTRDIPYEFNYLNVTFVLDDEDKGEKVLEKVRKLYGESLTMDEYPVPPEKDGFYVVWDYEGTDKVIKDLVITATYNRYRTTLAENLSSDSVYQSQILVDGNFKEGDNLQVTWSDVVNEGRVYDDEIKNLTSFGKAHVVIPDDGNNVHQLRFRPDNAFYTINGDFTLYLVTDNGDVELVPTGTMGKYKTFNLEGNDVMLSVYYEGLIKSAYKIYAIIVVVVLALLIVIVLLIIFSARHGRQLPRIFKRIRKNVSARIESKEQLFYNDEEDYKEKESKEVRTKEEIKEEKRAKRQAKKDARSETKKRNKKRK